MSVPAANGLIIFAVSKKISPSAEDDKEALPPVDLLNPLPCSHLCGFFANTKHQLKTIQKIEHNLAYMDYAMIFCL